MGRRNYVTTTLLLSLCLFGAVKCNPQEPQPQPQQQPNPQYRSDDSQKYSEAEYTDYSSNSEQTTIQCYSCHYEIRNGHTSGMEGCDKSNFIKTGIPDVTCPGPCATIFQKLGEEQFLLTRNCVPSCKEHRSETGTTECCYTSFCNAAVGHFRSAMSCVVMAVFGALLALVLRR